MTVADYANADPAVVKSGRVKKAVANAVEKEGKVYGSALLSLDKKIIIIIFKKRHLIS